MIFLKTEFAYPLPLWNNGFPQVFPAFRPFENFPVQRKPEDIAPIHTMENATKCLPFVEVSAQPYLGISKQTSALFGFSD